MSVSAGTALRKPETASQGLKIVVAAPKGGVGKTSTTRALLVAAAQAGRKAFGVDLDVQKSLTTWGARRAALIQKLPDAGVRPVEVRGVSLAEWRTALAEAADHDVCVFDTPPGIEGHAPQVRGLCERADLVLVPTGSTGDDLDATIAFATALEQAGVRSMVLLNRVNPRTVAYRSARNRVAAVATLAPVEIPAAEDIHQHSTKGLTALDVDKARGADALTALWQIVAREAVRR
jgi:chromosome partitioning protein